MKRKIYWKNIIRLTMLAIMFSLSLQDLAKIMSVPFEEFNNKILLLGQITTGIIGLLIYLIGTTGKLIEKKEKPKVNKLCKKKNKK